MTYINQQQFDSLKEKISDTLFASDEDNGLGEVGPCNEEAERIINEWMDENEIAILELDKS